MTKGGQQYQVVLSEGLDGQDDNIDLLGKLFEELQLATVEAADPSLDFITFAHSAHYFAVILETPAPPKQEEDGKDNNGVRTSFLPRTPYLCAYLPDAPSFLPKRHQKHR